MPDILDAKGGMKGEWHNGMPRENRNTISARNAERPSNAGGNLGSYDSVVSPPPQTRRLSVEEASSYTGLSCSTLNKLRCSGGGPRFAKVGRRVIYNVADLDAWLAKHLKTSTSTQ